MGKFDKGDEEPKDKCKVRVRLKDSAGNEIGRDASDNYFKINPSYIPPLEKRGLTYKP